MEFLELDLGRRPTGLRDLGDLPNWNLADLYASPTAPEFQADLESGMAKSLAFEARWKGKLDEAAGKSGADGIGAAVKEYEALEEEFALASAMIEARKRAGLTQEDLAKEMETSQSAIARLESGRTLPSGNTLKRFARATGTRLRITFEPVRSAAGRLRRRP